MKTFYPEKKRRRENYNREKVFKNIRIPKPAIEILVR